MSVYRLNSGLPMSTKTERLNDMIVELDGKIHQAGFNKNEIDSIYADTGIERKFKRDVVLGGTEDTYTDWTHLKSESGYSIWKCTPNKYKYNKFNELYVNNKLVVNRGVATSESVELFNKVFLYDGSTYVDNTTEAGTEGGTQFNLIENTDSYFYVGSSNKFNGVKLDLYSGGAEYKLKIEYYAGGGWIALTPSLFNLVDDTKDFLSSGTITWGEKVNADWATFTVNGSNLYWIRISTTDTPAITAVARYCIPTVSVVGLIALNSEQVTKDEWAWCSYGGNIYTTIRNIGNPHNEGSYYITSSSNDNNKRNFFIYNNKYTSNYEDSTYTPTDVGWVDFSDTVINQGWESVYEKEAYYKEVGGMIFVYFLIAGISNSKYTALNLPAPGFGVAPIMAIDNEINKSDYYIQIESHVVMAFISKFHGIHNAWTASGYKKVAGNFFYRKA